MKKEASIGRFEVVIGLLTLISLFLRLAKPVYFDQLFLFLGASWYLFYVIRMVLSFRQWKSSVAGTIINAGFFFSASFLLIAFLSRMLNWPGGSLISSIGLTAALLFTTFGLVLHFYLKEEWTSSWLRLHLIRQGFWILLTVSVIMIPRATLFRLFLPDLYNQPQPTTLYFRDGKVKARGNLLNGEKSGEWVFFSPEGDTTEVRVYD